MDSMERTSKTFRLQNRTLAKLDQLVSYENSLVENKMLPDVNEREMVERAIEHYHSFTFGKEVMDSILPSLQLAIGNQIDMKLEKYAEAFASGMNGIIMNGNVNRELLGLILFMHDWDPLQTNTASEQLENLAEDNKKVYAFYESLEMKKRNQD